MTTRVRAAFDVGSGSMKLVVAEVLLGPPPPPGQQPTVNVRKVGWCNVCVCVCSDRVCVCVCVASKT